MADLPEGPGSAAVAGAAEPAAGEAAAASGAVRRRTVLYLSGFDPQGAGRYHALYRNEAARQSRVTGQALHVGERFRDGPLASAWPVEMPLGHGERVQTRYVFLRWDDIVRAHWPRSPWRLWALTASTTTRMLANGSMWRFLQTSWPAFLALALPGLSLAASLALLGGSWLTAARLWPAAGWGASAIGLGGSWLAWRALAWMNARTQSDWLMRSARVILMQARGELPALEDRLQAFAERLLAELKSEDLPDEVLVVGHSSGAMLAISVVARALQHPEWRPADLQRLSVLTLGQCVPVLSYQPEAHRFRAELRSLRRQPGLNWLDVTAPPDGCCFALVDPTQLSRADALERTTGADGGPKIISARFATMFKPEAYRRIRRDKYRCHFQYLMASEQPAEHDYFAITAGPQRLMQRHAAQPSVHGYTAFQRFGSPLRDLVEDA
jgi:hypothetical protein